MRRTQTKGIADLIQIMKKEYKLERGLDRASVIRSWETVVGSAIANYTDKIYFNGNTLIVHLRSAVLRHELNGQREMLRKRLNDTAGVSFIENIILK